MHMALNGGIVVRLHANVRWISIVGIRIYIIYCS